MARHADPDASSFYRSLATAALRGLVAMVVVAALTVAVSLVSRPGGAEDADPTAASADLGATPLDADGQPAGDLEQGLALEAPAPEGPAPEGAGADAAPGDAGAQPPAGAPAPADTTVQVLDGVGDPARTEQAVDVLRDLGYEVVAVNPSAVDYDTTSILFSEGRQPHAEALRERDGRFAEISANANLSEAVDLHVVVGSDFPG